MAAITAMTNDATIIMLMGLTPPAVSPTQRSRISLFSTSPQIGGLRLRPSGRDKGRGVGGYRERLAANRLPDRHRDYSGDYARGVDRDSTSKGQRYSKGICP